jgi:hypothetical protein
MGPPGCSDAIVLGDGEPLACRGRPGLEWTNQASTGEEAMPDDEGPVPTTSRRAVLWPLLLVAALGAAACLLVNASQVIVWDGPKDVDLQFVVVDAKTKGPVPGAHVRVVDTWVGKLSYEAHTGADGLVRMTVVCMASGRQGLFMDTAAVHLANWQVRVGKEGYREAGPLELADFTGRGRAFNDLPPPPITIELRKVGR